MNTPSHMVLNLFVFGDKEDKGKNIAALAGALMPDLPMFFFYAWVKVVERMPEEEIWTTEYFKPGWQSFIDVFNAFPLMAVGAIAAWRFQKPVLLVFFLSMALHAAFDLPLHVDDGHAHFWPLTEWKFASPVSYWDPNHHGVYAATVEAFSVVVLSIWMAVKRYQKTWSRVLLGIVAIAAMGAASAIYVFAPT